jgi:hypothetical protein
MFGVSSKMSSQAVKKAIVIIKDENHTVFELKK